MSPEAQGCQVRFGLAEVELTQRPNRLITSHIYRYYCPAGHWARQSAWADNALAADLRLGFCIENQDP